MKKLLSVLVVMASLLVAPVVMARSAELVDPPSITVPAKANNEQVAKEIKRAMLSRGWTVEEEATGKINAVLRLRSHVARLLITHDAKQITLTYVSSENLKYKEKNGKRYIHKKYVVWVNNLAADINKNLQMLALDL